MRHFLTYTAIILFINSCSLFSPTENEQNGKPIARVFDQYLYPKEVNAIFIKETTAADSAELINNYVESWIRKNIIFHYAKRNPNIEQTEIDQKIKKYEESLICYYYEKELVKQKLDTVIGYDEIKRYFSNYKANFELKSDIIRMLYVKVAQGTPKIDSLKFWLKNFDDNNYLKLEDYCFQYAVNFNLDDSLWFLIADVAKEIPITINNGEINTFKKKLLELHDSANSYYIVINDHLKKGNISPLSFVMQDIKKIIINKRKLELIKRTYDNMYEEGLKKKYFEIYL